MKRLMQCAGVCVLAGVTTVSAETLVSPLPSANVGKMELGVAGMMSRTDMVFSQVGEVERKALNLHAAYGLAPNFDVYLAAALTSSVDFEEFGGASGAIAALGVRAMLPLGEGFGIGGLLQVARLDEGIQDAQLGGDLADVEFRGTESRAAVLAIVQLDAARLYVGVEAVSGESLDAEVQFLDAGSGNPIPSDVVLVGEHDTTTGAVFGIEFGTATPIYLHVTSGHEDAVLIGLAKRF